MGFDPDGDIDPPPTPDSLAFRIVRAIFVIIAVALGLAAIIALLTAPLWTYYFGLLSFEWTVLVTLMVLILLS